MINTTNIHKKTFQECKRSHFTQRELTEVMKTMSRD